MDTLVLEVVQSEALWERVVAALRRAIVIGELPPGSHLKEPLLAQRFGVSRLPVREAIASWIGKAWCASSPGVAPLSVASPSRISPTSMSAA